MKYLVEVEKGKEKFVLKLLNSFSFINVYPLAKRNLKFILGLQSSVEQVKKAKAGKLKLQSAKDFLEEL